MSKYQYKHYLLFVLMLVGIVGSFERHVFALAMEPIKLDLQLSDTQLGLLTGIAFSAFYAIAGLPIARWADRGNRITITSLAVGLLGVTVAACGAVSSFIQLLLVRVGVGVGEAGYIPAAQSIIADYFNRSERPRAMATYFSCFSISMIIGYWGGGWLIENLGWRITFMVIGLPCVVVALLVKFTLREPRLLRVATESVKPPSLFLTGKTLWQQTTFRQLFGAFCVAYFFSFGFSQWIAVFFMRSYEMQSGEIGAWFALTWGVCGLLGNYLGGYVASRYGSGNEKRQLRFVAVAYVVHMAASILVFLSPNQYMALFFLGLGTILGAFGNGPVFAAVQAIVSDRTRSTAVALLFMFANLIGLGFGPLTVGILSDALAPALAEESLRYSLILISPGYLWVAYHYWKAGNNIETDIQAIEQGSDTDSDELTVPDVSSSKRPLSSSDVRPSDAFL